MLGGKYRLVRPLAAGGMGSVWQAEHLALALPVAIKLMLPDESDVDARWRFLQEARIAVAVRSSHVVQVLDWAIYGQTPYMVMELLEGESLAARLLRVGRLSSAQTAHILAHLSDALGRAHRLGVVHRDLKPENVFIVDEGERELTKLLDFGVAKIKDERFGTGASRRTQYGDIIGTPQYMSPEQACGALGVDHRADVWALGVLAFECLAGRPPFRLGNLVSMVRQVCSDPLPVPSRESAVPRGFDGWFARACARHPDGRFPSVQVAASEFELRCAAPARVSPPSAPAKNRARAPSGVLRRCMQALALSTIVGAAAQHAGRLRHDRAMLMPAPETLR